MLVMDSPPYYIGCPVWTCPQWRGSVYSPRAKRDRWLAKYTRTFNTVEGNSTFYGIPSVETFQRWASDAADGFRFALKFPREITHECQLRDAAKPTEQFLQGLEILQAADHLGPSFLQMSPTFGPRQFASLQKYLEQLPTNFPYALELRHHGFFEDPTEGELNALLQECNIDRVIFDSRPLFASPPNDEHETRSQIRKPRVPIRTCVTGQTPMLRVIGRNDLSLVTQSVEEWADQVVDWIGRGWTPYVFTHTPDDRWAPEFALIFQNAVARKMNQEPSAGFQHEQPKQLKLF